MQQVAPKCLLSNPPTLNESQNNRYDRNHEQDMNDIAQPETAKAEKSEEPDDNQYHGHCVKNVSHCCVC